MAKIPKPLRATPASYLDLMSRYVPNLWRLRADLIVLFLIIGVAYAAIGAYLYRSDSPKYVESYSSSTTNQESKDCKALVQHVEYRGRTPAGSDWKSASNYYQVSPSIDKYVKDNHLRLDIRNDYLPAQASPDTSAPTDAAAGTTDTTSSNSAVAPGDPDAIPVFNPNDCGFLLRAPTVNFMVIGTMVVPSLLILILAYALCRSVRLREVVGLQQRPHFAVLLFVNLAIFLPFAAFGFYVFYYDLSPLSYLPPLIAVGFSFLIALFVRAINLSKFSTTLYGAILSLIVLALAATIGILSGTCLHTALYDLPDYTATFLGFLISTAITLIPMIYITVPGRVQGKWSKLAGIMALFCLPWSYGAAAGSAMLLLNIMKFFFLNNSIIILISLGMLVVYVWLIELCSTLLIRRAAMPRHG